MLTPLRSVLRSTFEKADDSKAAKNQLCASQQNCSDSPDQNRSSDDVCKTTALTS
jgi:hypothetical protein